MTTQLFRSTDRLNFYGEREDAILRKMLKEGRLPPVKVIITSLQNKKSTIIDRFTSYEFNSSILIPVDTFSMTFSAPEAEPTYDIIKEGDLISVTANDFPIWTGIVDMVAVHTNSSGEVTTISGRDLMGQLEDHDAISIDSRPIWANQITLQNAVRQLISETRIRDIRLKRAPSRSYLFSTEPSEKKLSALQRFLEPLNCIAWMSGDGIMNIGKPSFDADRSGKFILSRTKRYSNVIAMGVQRQSATIANIIVPIWTGQELAQDKFKEQNMINPAEGPSRLYKLGHRLPKTIVVSNPDATTSQGQSDVNRFQFGNQNLLQAYGKREIHRQNTNEMIVTVEVPGHFNNKGRPFIIDTVYDIEYDRGSVDKLMYCMSVTYSMAEGSGQRTNLQFCNLGTIVSDATAP